MQFFSDRWLDLLVEHAMLIEYVRFDLYQPTHLVRASTLLILPIHRSLEPTHFLDAPFPNFFDKELFLA